MNQPMTSMNHTRRIHSRLAAAMLCLLLASCGFHLRGQAALPFETMYVSGSANFRTLLTRAIRAGSSTRIRASLEAGEIAAANAVIQKVGVPEETLKLALEKMGKAK